MSYIDIDRLVRKIKESPGVCGGKGEQRDADRVFMYKVRTKK